MLARYLAALVRVDLVVEALGLLLVSELVVFHVDVVAQQPVDGEEDSRQLVQGDYIVIVEIVQLKDKVDLLVDGAAQELRQGVRIVGKRNEAAILDESLTEHSLEDVLCIKAAVSCVCEELCDGVSDMS